MKQGLRRGGLPRLRTIAAIAVLGVVGLGVVGGRDVAESQPTTAPPTPHSGSLIASSATGVQSFAWIVNDAQQTVIFCYSTATPQMGPQFDFTCRRHPFPTD
jgi:hypothetical protein